jgi:apolipoprotein N-acyltransferase
MRNIILALLSSALLVLSFPKFDLHFLAWVALIPLFTILNNKRPLHAFILSYLMGICFMIGIFYWINLMVTFVDFMLMILYLSLHYGLFGLIFTTIDNKKIVSPFITAPVLWISFEYLRANAGFLALPWALLGHSQYLNIPLIQIASITGVYGISVMIVLVNLSLTKLIQGGFSSYKPVIFAFLPMVLSSLYGLSVVSDNYTEGTLPVTVVQGNIDMDRKLTVEFQRELMRKQEQLTRKAVKGIQTSLIVWPEGTVRGLLMTNYTFKKIVSGIARDTRAHILVGSARRPKIPSGKQEEASTHKAYNSAFIFDPNGKFKYQYNKIRLLPFGEYLPLKSFPWPDHYFSIDNHIPGDKYSIFRLDKEIFGVTICWENLFPDVFRRFVKKGAHFMVNITNELWFGDTSAPYQFLSMSVFRAVENRVPVVRSSNTGVSGFISPYGKILDRVTNNERDIFVEGYLTYNIPLSKARTFYTVYGNIFAYLCIGVSLIVLAHSYRKADRRYQDAR